MAIASTNKRLDINFSPLQTSTTIEVVGSVPDRQIWSADTNEFTPDYKLTPLVLYPRCNAADADRYIKSEAVNASLTNMRWYEIQGAKRKLIESGNTDYEITTEGIDKGKLKLKRNSSVMTPLGLEFYAEYADVRTRQVYVFRASTVIPVSDATVPAPVLTIDSPSTVVWNPVRQPAQRTIKARVMAGDKDVTTSEHTKVFWYRKLETGELEAITDGNGENDWEVTSVSGAQLTIDLDYIGDNMTYICKAVYNPTEVPGEQPTDSDPMISTTIRRRIPHIEADWMSVPQGVASDTTVIYPVAVIRDTVGVIQNADNWFKCLWFVKRKGENSYQLAGEGMKPGLAFSEGMMLRLDVEDRSPMAVIVDEDGSFITDEDGSFLVQRFND